MNTVIPIVVGTIMGTIMGTITTIIYMTYVLKYVQIRKDDKINLIDGVEKIEYKVSNTPYKNVDGDFMLTIERS